ncbi:MAG: ABC transporter ATP-binding protein [Bacteroidales bacterium]|nr:ABC transporter ATP-binding protein [Bacteroidales bacterium]
MAKEAVIFKNVTKIFGSGEGSQKAVDNVSFSINKGEFVVILGQSGAGKSTVLNMLGGLDKQTKGEIIINGEKLADMNETKLAAFRAKTIGFIFQFYNLLPSLTAYENVALTKDILKNALDPMEMLKRVGLEKQANKFPSQMSGGEQQRVSIARAISKNPPIILGDEPTGALDSKTGVTILELLWKLNKENGNTIIIVTHNADIARCADKVIIMKNGKIKEITVNENPIPVKEVQW